MYRVGIVTELDVGAGRLKARLLEDDVVTPWLDVLVSDTLTAARHGLPAVDTQVAIMLDEDASSGVVLGAIYSSAQPVPSEASDASAGIVFSDGCKIAYDVDTHILNVELPSGGELRVGGTRKVAMADDVESAHDAIKDDLANHQHLAGTLVAPAGMAGGPVTGVSGAAVVIVWVPQPVGSDMVKSG